MRKQIKIVAGRRKTRRKKLENFIHVEIILQIATRKGDEKKKKSGNFQIAARKIK